MEKPMQLLSSPVSGFGRKARIVALELGLGDRVEMVFLSPQQDVERLSEVNPMGKVPVLIDGGRRIFDSSVICEFFCSLAGDQTLLPPSDPLRFDVLTAAALGDGLLEAGMLMRAEELRDPKSAS